MGFPFTFSFPFPFPFVLFWFYFMFFVTSFPFLSTYCRNLLLLLKQPQQSKQQPQQQRLQQQTAAISRWCRQEVHVHSNCVYETTTHYRERRRRRLLPSWHHADANLAHIHWAQIFGTGHQREVLLQSASIQIDVVVHWRRWSDHSAGCWRWRRRWLADRCCGPNVRNAERAHTPKSLQENDQLTIWDLRRIDLKRWAPLKATEELAVMKL